MRFVLLVVRAAIMLALVGLSLVTILAFLGFAVPIFDMFNHFQPFWLVGLVVTILLALVAFPRQPGRGAAVSIGFTGLLASLVIVIPEFFAGIAATPPPPETAPTYRLMSRNLFGLNYEMEDVLEAISRENPDIIALQEFFTEQQAGLRSRLETEYPYFASCTGGRRAAIALYSRIPFEASADSVCPDNITLDDNRIAWLIGTFEPLIGEPFSVLTTHLNWPIQISPLFRDEWTWTQRITAMTSRKLSEFEQLDGAVAQVEGPLLVVGDFNATPWSYQLRQFAGEAGLDRQTHLHFTYPTRFWVRGWRNTVPFLPLDHLLTRGVNVHSVRTTDPAGSDHRALLAVFSVL